MAAPLWSGTCVAHWRAADVHARVHVSSRPTLAPSARESESRSGAARARRMTASSAASPMQPHHPRTAPLSTAVIAPEDVEHPVGRRREAHATAPGGARAGGGQRRPGVGRWAEAVHVVQTVACGGRRGAHVRLHPQARALRAAAGALWPQVRRAAGRSQACQARPSCILGADPGRAPRLPGEAEGQDAAAGAGGSRIVFRLHLAELINEVVDFIRQNRMKLIFGKLPICDMLDYTLHGGFPKNVISALELGTIRSNSMFG
jgi:hypothetical protein